MSKQIEDKSLNYKAAFKYFYNKAKIINLIIIFINFIIAISLVINGIYSFYENKLVVFIIFIWTLISIYLNAIVSKNKRKAANLQELFDTYVLGIKKNEKIMYPNDEEIRLSRLCMVNKEKYYDIDDEIIEYIDILNIQKENIVYDKKMRGMYFWGNLIFILMYTIIMISMSIKFKFDMYDLIVLIIAPSINIFNYIVGNVLKLNSELNELKNAEVEIKHFISDLDTENDPNIEGSIREFQDFIYLKRRNWTMIPNYIYNIDKIFKSFTYGIEETNRSDNKVKLKDEAIKIEKKLGIIKYLGSYGRVEIVGAVANDLIVKKDIDIHLLTNLDINVICGKLVKYLNLVKLIKKVEVEDFQVEKKSICITIANYFGWQIEIWLSNDDNFVGFQLAEELKQKLDKDKRKTIMDIKKYYYKKDLLHGELSTLIYKSVIYGSVKSLEEFKEYICENIV
jgi:hypothetical protein